MVGRCGVAAVAGWCALLVIDWWLQCVEGWLPLVGDCCVGSMSTHARGLHILHIVVGPRTARIYTRLPASPPAHACAFTGPLINGFVGVYFVCVVFVGFFGFCFSVVGFSFKSKTFSRPKTKTKKDHVFQTSF